MRHRAANRAAAARLCMPDPRQRGGKQRLARTRPAYCSSVALSHGGADADRAVGAFDAIKARQPHNVEDDARPRHAHAQHGHQRLPAGENARVRTFVARAHRAPRRGSRRAHSRMPRVSRFTPRRLRALRFRSVQMRRKLRRRCRQIDSVERKRVGDRIGDADRRRHAIAFADAFGAERRERRRRFAMQDHRLGHFHRRRHEIVGEGAGQKAPSSA